MESLFQVSEPHLRTHSDHRGGLTIVRPETEVGFRQLLQSSNPRAGTVRGLHCSPYPKQIKVIIGRLEDFCMCMNPENKKEQYLPRKETLTTESGWRVIPAHQAHGFRTLEDNTVMVYLTGGDFEPSREREQNPWNRYTGWNSENAPIISGKDAAGPPIPMVDIYMIGGTGFIGSHMIMSLKYVRPEWNITQCPYRLEQVERIKEHIAYLRPRFVINAAGLTGSPNTAALEIAPGAARLMEVNLTAPTELIRYIRSGVVPGTRFLQVGSGMIFTEGSREFHGDMEIGDRGDLSQCLFRNALERVVRDGGCDQEAKKKVLYLRYHLPQSWLSEYSEYPTNFAVKVRGFTRVSNLMTSASPLDELHPGLAVILEKFEIGDFFGVKNFCGRRPLLLKEIAGAPSGEVDNGGNRDDDGILKQGVLLDAREVWRQLG